MGLNLNGTEQKALEDLKACKEEVEMLEWLKPRLVERLRNTLNGSDADVKEAKQKIDALIEQHLFQVHQILGL